MEDCYICHNDPEKQMFCSACMPEECKETLPTTRKEFRAELADELYCGFCKPNRGENRKHGSYKRMKREPKQEKLSKERNEAREFKKKQK